MSNCKVIALTNQKGGVGKTTTAVNLGVSLAQQGKKVLLIDADAQANLTMSLGYNRPDDLPVTLSTIMQDIIEDNPIDVQKSILHHGEGVDLLPSNIELSGLEVRLINAISRERVLKTCVNEVKKNYDYCLIDCMPSLGMLTINALAAADSVVIPTQPHYLSAKGLELLLRSVSKVRRQINPPLRIDGILMTMVMPRTNISKEITATVRSAYGQKIKVFDTAGFSSSTFIPPSPLSPSPPLRESRARVSERALSKAIPPSALKGQLSCLRVSSSPCLRLPRLSSIPMRRRSRWYGAISGNLFLICSSLSVRSRWQTVWYGK